MPVSLILLCRHRCLRRVLIEFRFIWLTAFLSLTFLQASFGAPNDEMPNKDEMHQMQLAVSYPFLDPDSAKFRNVRKSILGYCGEVNAKNAFGAYVGYKAFHAMLEDKTKKWLITYEPQLVRVVCK